MVLGRLQLERLPRLTRKKIARARDLISGASRPVILAGLGLEPEAPYDALRTLVEAANAPVIVSPKGKGALPDDHPLSAGVIGLTRSDPVYEILDEADCVIAVGFDVVELVKPFSLPLVGEDETGEGTANAPLIWIANWPNRGPGTAGRRRRLLARWRRRCCNLRTAGSPPTPKWGRARVA